MYIIYSIENVASDLNCSVSKAVKAMAELDSVKGIGLIERKKRGQGNPDLIYVKNFSSAPEKNPNGNNESSRFKSKAIAEYVQNGRFENPEIENSENVNSEMEQSRNVEVSNLECFESASIYTDMNNKEINNTNNYLNHINLVDTNQAGSKNQDCTDMLQSDNGNKDNKSNMNDMIDAMDETLAYMDMIKENIDHDTMMSDQDWHNKELYDELYELICDVVCVSRKTIRIAGEDYPYALVRSKFLKLNASHLQYVMDCMHKNTSKISNIKAYLITALYNAPNTMGNYYNAAVNYDMYSGYNRSRYNPSDFDYDSVSDEDSL